MRKTMLCLLIVQLGLLGGCGGGGNKEQVIGREHKAKAADMCKNDKGVKEVIEANGASFTAQCKSGIIVAGIAMPSP